MKQIAIAITCGFALAATAVLAQTVIMQRQWNLVAEQDEQRIETRRLEEQQQQQQRVLEQRRLVLEQQRLDEARRLEEQQQQRVLQHQQRLAEARRLEEQQQRQVPKERFIPPNGGSSASPNDLLCEGRCMVVHPEPVVVPRF